VYPRKLMYGVITLALLVAPAVAQTSSESEVSCQAVGGMILTNVGGFGPNTTMGVVKGDLAGAIGVEILGITTGKNGVVDVAVQHHWVTDTGDTLTINNAHAFGVFVAPGLLAVTKYKAHMSGGTGKYSGTTGDFSLIGELDFNTGHVVLRFTGRTCTKSS